MEAFRDQLAELAASPWHGRIEGQRGSGKGLAAQVVHAWSPRSARPFFRQSMSALPPGLELARLYGWSRGGFTGAIADVPGLLEEANGSTLFLDEIVWTRKRMRGALLQALEDTEVQRIGERRARKVDVRLLFATNVDLDGEAAAGRFAEDLLDRMGVLLVRVPTLREHLEDLEELVSARLAPLSAEIGRPAPTVSAAEFDVLRRYPWPGNVRQLENALKHRLTFNAWPAFLAGVDTGERARLEAAIRRHGGNKRRTARALGMSPTTLYQKIERPETNR